MMWIMIDIEADGPIPGDYSMISLGAVAIEPGLNRTFYGQLIPISTKYVPEALKVSGFNRDQTKDFDDPKQVMKLFEEWLVKVSDKPRFISDNNGFDWQFVNWYFHHFLGNNPFGFSSTNLGSLYKGVVRNMKKNFKHLRKTPHSHHPVEDCLGNCEAMLEIIEKYDIQGF